MDDGWARERREFIRNHHPDRGGDGTEFIAGLARYERMGPPERARSHDDRRVRVVVVPRRSLWSRLMHAWHDCRHPHRPRVH
ncbi:hypothetical protein [Actinoplanes sp. NPDC049118]|uniref:hypothetical protein n=1 Tax=Actinoplanes sp. NPDC049118 TaxID=3155769 RepID=UPI0033F80DDF